MQDLATVQAIGQLLYDKKAKDIVVLKVSHLTVVCDYMIICTGRSTTQVSALTNYVQEKMAELNIPVLRKEGEYDGHWSVLDYGHILIHIFHPDERAYYALERLWEDGTNRVELAIDQTEA